MTVSYEEADARWMEAVIRIVDGLSLRDGHLAMLLLEQHPDQGLVLHRLEELAAQEKVSQQLSLVEYRPPLKPLRPRSAILAEKLVQLRLNYRSNAELSLELDRAV